MRKSSHTLVLSGLLVLGATAQAVPVVDQELDAPTNIVTPFYDTRTLAQSITVGVTGQVTSVDVLLRASGVQPGAQVTVDVRGLSGENPSDVALASAVIDATSIPGTLTFINAQFSPPYPFVVAGQRLTVVASANITSDSVADGQILWGGVSPGSSYTGGTGYESSGPGAWVPASSGGPYDRPFRTYVEPLASAAGGLADCGVSLDAVLAGGGLEKPVEKKLTRARKNLTKAEGAHALVPPKRIKAVKKTGKAMKDVGKAVKKGYDSGDGADIRAKLVAVAAVVVEDAVQEAVLGAGDAAKIAAAEDAQALGDQAVLDGDLDLAAKHYKRAAKKAKQAL